MAKKKFWIAAMTVSLAGGLIGCASLPPGDYNAMLQDVLKSSFTDSGIAKVDRLVQVDDNRECSEADAANKPIAENKAKAIEAANLATVKWPAGGYYIGDWKQGESIAQSGRGMTWSDSAGATNGGNCYNCHQIRKEEISYGTLGPSLYNYGKLRGVKDLYAPESSPIIQYTWGKIYNSRAYNACSAMPRAGHKGILNEEQMRHIMALLLDPNSPVNK